MLKKVIVKVLIILAAVILFAGLCVLTFVDIKSLKIHYIVNYETTEGGRIEGNIRQSVQKGKDAQTVTAVPDEGYRFLRWADTSSPNPERTDTNIVKDIKPQAKFVKISNIKQKILLVHVTEVQGTFKDIDGNDVVVDYKMTEEDLAVCRMITELFDICMNEMLDGLVTFEIDEYYTKEVVREECFNYKVADNIVWPSIYPQRIPEVAEKLSDYMAFISTVQFNYPNYAVISNIMDCAAMVYLRIPRMIMPSGESVNDYRFINDYSNYHWVSLVGDYVHQYIYTVTNRITKPKEYYYGNVLIEYENAYMGRDKNRYVYEIAKLFMLNQAMYNGEKVGIPFSVWTNEIYEVYYKCNVMYMGETPYYPIRVAKGCDCEVEAIPRPGYKFSHWSDGVQTAKRIDKNIQGDMEITAYFEPQEYSITYLATEGGHIEGKTNQKTYGINSFEHVLAVAEEGYKFIGWSDQKWEYASRVDFVTVVNVGEFENNNNNLVVTAIFEKVN